ncbi:MAG: hypothetical protein RIS64_4009 [Bacteroidota bacterium]|jgi:uncharacterized membrane protein YfcA
MEYVGYFSSILIGVSLGLIGGGGSVLTLPVLVYLFSVETVTATAYSLFIVGITSIVGCISYFRKGLVHVKTAIVFGIPSIIAVFLTRAYLIPTLPKILMTFDNFVLTKNGFLLLLFGILMVVAAYSMIKKRTEQSETIAPKQVFNYPLILLEGALVGMFTGLVGAGGGFLIIPALVTFSKLPMKEAIGTSLVIIAAKSLIGFWGESSETVMDWALLLKISSLASIGVFIGMAISTKIDSAKLKPIFGWFILGMGLFIITKEIIFKNF